MKIGDRTVRVGVALAGLLPLAGLILAGASDDLGADPVETITHRTGEWALRFLLLGLCITPLRRLLDAPGLLPHRRTLGLLAFLYASLHFATYLALDLDFRIDRLGEDLAERPFIAVGFAALVLLAPLALTSSRRFMRRLGPNWRRLHRLVYPAIALTAIHFIWSAKADLLEPGLYAGVAAALLGIRGASALGRKRADYATLRRAKRTAGPQPGQPRNPDPGPEGRIP